MYEGTGTDVIRITWIRDRDTETTFQVLGLAVAGICAAAAYVSGRPVGAAVLAGIGVGAALVMWRGHAARARDIIEINLPEGVIRADTAFDRYQEAPLAASDAVDLAESEDSGGFAVRKLVLRPRGGESPLTLAMVSTRGVRLGPVARHVAEHAGLPITGAAQRFTASETAP